MRLRRAKAEEPKDHAYADEQIDRVQNAVLKVLDEVFRLHNLQFWSYKEKRYVTPYCDCFQCERFRLWKNAPSRVEINLEEDHQVTPEAQQSTNAGLDGTIETSDD